MSGPGATTALHDLDAVMGEFRAIVAGTIRPATTLVLASPAGGVLVALGIDHQVHPSAYHAFATQRLLSLVRPQQSADYLGYASLTRPASPGAPGLLLVRVEVEALPDVPLLLDSRRHFDVIGAMAVPCQVALADRRDIDAAAAMPVEEAIEHLKASSLLFTLTDPDPGLARMLGDAVEDEP